MIKILIYGVTAFFVGMLISPVFAHHKGTVINIYETTEVTEVTQVVERPVSITDRVSKSELAEGLTAAAAVGSHQFDYSVQAWQASITGSVILDESQDAISIGLAKRFDSMDVLWHGAVTRTGSLDLLSFGATFRF